MAGHDGSQDTDFEQVSSNLDEGLKTCRAVVRSYRELLIGDPVALSADNDDQPAKAQLGSPPEASS